MEENLLNNRSFREDMKIFLTFFVIVPAIAAASAFLCGAPDKNKSNKPQTESVQPKEDKAINVQNTLKITNFTNQR